MLSYWQLLLLILPLFAIIAVGVLLRRMQWLTKEADESLLNVVVKFLSPCLIFDSVLGNPALKHPPNMVLPPLVGFLTMSFSLAVAFWVARMLGMARGTGLRTFAFATGVSNYGYIPIPLMAALFGRDSLGVLFMHNVGCDAAFWTVSILVLSGLSLREGWRKVSNPPVWALMLAVALNLCGLAPCVPDVLRSAIHLSAQCTIPLGLLLIGAILADYILSEPLTLVDARVTPVSCALRLGLFPMTVLLAARFLPVSRELKQVMVVQAPMPAGIFAMVIARHYGGKMPTAVQVVVATSLLGLLVIPLWLRFGLTWVLG
jgi:predicted permease